MKMLKLLPLCASLIILTTITAGCQYDAAQTTPPTTPQPTSEATTMTHLKFVVESPTSDQGASVTQAEAYVIPTGSRITLQDADNVIYALWDGHNQYLYTDSSDDTGQNTLPDNHPLKDAIGEPIIKITGTTADNIFSKIILDPLTISPGGIDTTKTAPYTVEVPYYENEVDPPVTRRYTIDPANQLATQVETIDEVGNVYERYIVESRKTIPVPTDFFTIEQWQNDLPGDDFTIVEDDLN